jgi:hypothetical protein
MISTVKIVPPLETEIKEDVRFIKKQQTEFKPDANELKVMGGCYACYQF